VAAFKQDCIDRAIAADDTHFFRCGLVRFLADGTLFGDFFCFEHCQPVAFFAANDVHKGSALAIRAVVDDVRARQ
jgi:hypothetical protein